MEKVLSTRPSAVATSALRAIPFGNIIGGPLQACVNAQRYAAETTIRFINDVGLQEVPVLDPNGKPIKRPKLDSDNNPIKDVNGNIVEEQVMETQAVYVCFQFIQAGRMVRINVPMLSIVPIPYIAINTIDINFKANISASASTTDEDTTTRQTDHNYGVKNKTYGVSWGRRMAEFGIRNSEMKASISSKKDSKGTAESKYSVEYTMDVAVHASQDSMPAGMAKILEMIGNAIDLCDPQGEFMVNSSYFELTGPNKVRLEVLYKNPEGLFSTKESDFKLYTDKGVEVPMDRGRERATASLGAGVYTLKNADGSLTEIINVVTITDQPKSDKKATSLR